MDFKGKVVLVTGGAMGIGKGICRVFLEKGAKVSICDVNIEEGRKTLQEFEKEFGKNRVIFTKCDVSKDEDFEAAYNECEKSLGVINILINNAGIQHKELKKLIAVNFEGPVRGTELAIKRMGKHNGGNGGHVVNIASVAALVAYPYAPYYSAVKAATMHFSRVMGGKFHHDYHGVSVFCLCPGGVRTVMNTKEVLARTSYNELAAEKIKGFEYMSSILEPTDIGEAVVRLINENKTGEVVMVDKGSGFNYIPPSLDTNFMGLVD